MAEAPLNYEASVGNINLSTSSTLPNDVIQCLSNARFLHLATCTSDLHPHVSLMNYTYLASTPFSSAPTIIMTTNPSSRKTLNLISNPNVSLLVHDWVSHRPTPALTTSTSYGSPAPASPAPSSLALLLANLNTSELSSISATINGEARLVERGTEEERYLRGKHLENNTFDGGEQVADMMRRESVSHETGDGGRVAFVEGEDVRVLVVKIRDGRVADWKGGVRDWRLDDGPRDSALVNGV